MYVQVNILWLQLFTISELFSLSCKDGLASYSCNCTGTGYTGERCQDNINECMDTRYPHRCQNNATCIDREANYSCQCKDGFTGNCFLFSLLKDRSITQSNEVGGS